MITDLDFGWLCGILEGEGTFFYKAHTQTIRIVSTDKDVVDRAAYLIEQLIPGVATRAEQEPSPTAHGKQTQYTACIYGENARSLMRNIVGQMSWRRRRRIWQCLNKFTEPKLDILKLMKRA